jgi:NADH:ubiquinone oxidoreductase subunit K
MPDIFGFFGIAAVLVMIIGFFSILVSRNLIRTLIGMEILTKSVTLLIILAGYLTHKMGLAQAMAITLIIIEVALTVVAVGIVLCIFRHDNDIDAANLRNLKG